MDDLMQPRGYQAPLPCDKSAASEGVPGEEGAIALGTARQQAVLFDGDAEVRQHLPDLLLFVGGAHIEGLVRVAHPDEGSVAG